MRTIDITKQRLLSSVSYDPKTGVFTRVGRSVPNSPIGARVDLLVDSGASAGYRRIKVGGTRFMAHRLAWLAVYGELPSGEIDHINGIRDDNRIANLRDVPHAINMQNRRKCNNHSKTGVLGVQQKGGKFVACISHQGRSLKLGTFQSSNEAHDAYLKKKRALHQGCTL